MRRQIFQSGVDTQKLFEIEAAIDGSGYFAVRDAKPRFALFSETIEGAAAAAKRALSFSEATHDPR